MSWLSQISDIAGKAEKFLNDMDKSAASAISQATTAVQNTSLGSTLSSPSGPSSRSHSRKVSMKSDVDTNDSGSMTHGFDTEFIET